MNNFLILCDGAQKDIAGFDKVIPLTLSGSNPNLKATIKELSHILFQELDTQLEDFLRIATFVHAADGAIERGRELDVYAKKWVRNFSFAIPVLSPDFWNQERVKVKLNECLSFLSDDKYKFDFIKRSPPSGQQMLEFKLDGLPQAPGADSILTISGGLDSLAGAIQSVKEHSLHPVLVGHWSATRMKSRQKTVVEGLREKIPDWGFPWIGMWSHYKGRSAIERTQRCRSFLFLTLATVCAKQAGLEIVRMNDNGITSVNLPHTDATRGAFVTRSTHPKFFYLYQQLVKELTGPPLVIENTLLNNTKADVAKIIAEHECAELIQETCSCFQIIRRTGMQQHCGTCPQCVDRRFAPEIARLTDFNIPERYETDIFTDPLKEGEMRTNAENYVRFAFDVKDMTEDSFIEKYSPVWDCVSHLPDQDIEDSLISLAKLHIRHSQQVWELIEAKCQENVRKRIEGKLPHSSLVGMVFSNEIHSNLQERYVHKLAEMISSSIPAAFEHERASRETQVQDVANSCFIAAQERLNREVPMLPFAGVGMKPDFSKMDPAKSNNDWLFIEFKYPKERRDKNRIITEITSRILAYKKQAAYALFVVYDPSRAIINDNEFRVEMEQYEKVWVVIIR